MPITPNTGLPGIPAQTVLSNSYISAGGPLAYLPGGATIDGTKARDPGNSAYSTFTLRCGLLLGKATSGGKYSNSIIGVTTGALSTGSSITISAAGAAELVRRVGSTGNLSLTGPTTASGTARTLTVAYSAVNTTTGVITITNPGVNEVQTLTFGAAATGGTYRFRVPLANGTFVTTGPITWDTTDATLLSNINTALDAATGVSGGIVATGATPDTTLIFTFSGTGYSATAQPTEMISVITFPTSATTATTVRTTTGVSGAFIAGSFVGATDGTQTPCALVGNNEGIIVPDDSTDCYEPLLVVGGTILQSQIPHWPSDTGLRTWVRTSLSTLSGGKFVFMDQFTA